MIITKLELEEGIDKSLDKFTNGFNLFTSLNENSVGKTTYCRLLLHSLGFSIPATEGINFDKISSKIFLTERNKNFILYRQCKRLTVEIENEDFCKIYTLPDEHISFLSFLFDCENI